MERRFRPGLASGVASGLALALLGALAWGGASHAEDAHGQGAHAEEAGSQPLLVKIHADWCGTCERLNPTWEQLDARLGDSATLVVLDVTDRDAVTRSQREAERLGIADFFAAHRSKTGTIAVLDGATREPLEVLKGVTDVSRYLQAVERARAQRPS